MIITQAGDKLTLEANIKTDEGDNTINDTYMINGKEVEISQKRNGQEFKGKRLSKWLADDSGFESSEEIAGERSDGVPISQQITRKWVISADGKTFSVEMSVKRPIGTQHAQRVLVKK